MTIQHQCMGCSAPVDSQGYYHVDHSLRDRIKELEEENARLKKTMEKLRSTGRPVSNIAYNLGQLKGDRDEWDRVIYPSIAAFDEACRESRMAEKIDG